jgi:hypothetical protein
MEIGLRPAQGKCQRDSISINKLGVIGNVYNLSSTVDIVRRIMVLGQLGQKKIKNII